MPLERAAILLDNLKGTLALYLSIARHVWRPFGSPPGEPGPPKRGARPGGSDGRSKEKA